MAVGLGYHFIYLWERKNIAGALKSFEEQHRELMISVINTQSSKLRTFLADYTQWDELTVNSFKQDTAWLEKNVSYALDKYDISWLWLFDRDFRLMHEEPGKDQQQRNVSFPDKGQLMYLLANNPELHFFLKSTRGLIEIYGSPIHLQEDPERQRSAEGWIFVGKNWNDSLLSSLGKMTSSSLSLDTSSIISEIKELRKSGTDRIRVSLVLEGWSGKPVGLINSEKEIIFLGQYRNSFNRFLLISLALALLFFTGLGLIISRFVNLPLDYLNKTLEHRDLRYLKPLRYQKGRFGKLSESIVQLFAKEALLQEEDRRRRLETQLLQSENRFRLLVENNPDVLWICDGKGIMVYVSPNVSRVLGVFPEDILENNQIWEQRVHPDDYQEMREHFNRFVFDNEQYQSEYRWNYGDEKEIWVAEKAISKFEADGSIYSCGRISDITVDKLYKKFVYESEQQYRSLFDQNPMGVVLISLKDFSFMKANIAFCEMLGYAEDELTGLTIRDITPEEDVKLEMRAAQLAREENKDSFVVEKRLITKEGNIIWVSVTISYLLDQDGTRIMGCGVVENITERKRMLDALNHEHRLLVGLMENIPDLVYFRDGSGRIVHMNQAMAATLKAAGFSESEIEEIRGRQDHMPGLISLMMGDEEITQTDEPLLDREIAISGSEGETIWYSVSKIPIKPINGLESIMVGILRDITALKMNEIRLEAYASELKNSNLAKDKFLSILAHDLKNPFNAILGFTSVLLEEYGDYTDEERRHFLENIHHATQNTYNLVQNILFWSRSQSGGILYQPSLQDFSVLINETYNLLRPDLERKHIRFISRVALNTQAFFDDNTIRTVIRNLLSNAVKFSNPGGMISICCRKINDRMLEVCVEDQGIGIPEQAMEKLFRIDDSYKREGTFGEQGTGLGLILCKEFVERNGGVLWVISQEGKGSRFYFSVPLKAQTE
ncbi:MAG TPA: PAS domain S-box protein [Bacteroidales bacterium]|nr:PAS domain S-box protein [Bacteroidales bacterium]HSA42743.1 PAS domain S-box protein [Bacteroidales bacterium]